MADALSQEKKTTLTNGQNDIKDARVVANYGDPGLDEDYHFDILSRYVVVMIESTERIPTKHHWMGMFALVKRPRQLWIDMEGSLSTPATQKRSDGLGNVTVGPAGTPSVAGIARINRPYYMGELIKIKKLSAPLKSKDNSFFSSSFPFTNGSMPSYGYYIGNNHTQGSQIPYIANNAGSSLSIKTLSKGIDEYHYAMQLRKYQYEAFALQKMGAATNNLVALFAKTLHSNHAVYSANGGYLFNNNSFLDIHAVEFEDLNLDNKQRVATSDCMPLIVATPNSFPTPKVRALGTIAYNPTYAEINKQ